MGAGRNRRRNRNGNRNSSRDARRSTGREKLASAPAAAPLKRAASRPAKWPLEWIPPLAEPYLRGYVPHMECGQKEVPHMECGEGDVPRMECGEGDVPRMECGEGDVPRMECGEGDVPRMECGEGEVPHMECGEGDVPRMECEGKEVPHIECGKEKVAPIERGKLLSGYRFLAPGVGEQAGRRGAAAPAAGFFVGYLLDASGFPFLRAEPPECLIFCFVEPVGSPLHDLLVAGPESLVRRTAEYIRWLTHRPPRFEFFPDQPVALVRHASMRSWPPAKYEHFSRNFFIETLAWLVRSALVRRLPAQLNELPALISAARRSPRTPPRRAPLDSSHAR
jgi:hypothetical protein